jgi:hypothetical protein
MPAVSLLERCRGQRNSASLGPERVAWLADRARLRFRAAA